MARYSGLGRLIIAISGPYPATGCRHVSVLVGGDESSLDHVEAVGRRTLGWHLDDLQTSRSMDAGLLDDFRC
jgi:hypothetical protein